MGEYIELADGSHFKLGTCEDLYYVRHDQMPALLFGARRLEGNLPPQEYLNPALGWRFRFPFPDEDGNTEFSDYDRGLLIHIHQSHPFADAVRKWEHVEVCRSVACGKSHSYNVNIFVPCPSGKDIDKFRHSPLPKGFPVEIVRQKLMPDGLWTVVRCAYCHNMFRLPLDEAEKLVITLRGEGTNFHDTVADRILAGYQSADHSPNSPDYST